MDKSGSLLKFECHIEERLCSFGIDFKKMAAEGLSAAAAVSGGADSVSLLAALCEVCRKYGVSVKAVTVNHNIRPAEESGGDAEFVAELVEDLKSRGFEVELKTFVLKPGEVFRTAEKRGNGIEEAARFLRYKAFDDFFEESRCGFIALAHNRNDQVETVLMRFLQGSGTGGLSGISAVRGKFVRPLLDVSREEIEAYLNGKGLGWRTDRTNFDVHYMRNRIRQKLIPFLKENFPGFDKALINGAEKAAFDDEALKGLLDGNFWSVSGDEESVYCRREKFDGLGMSQQLRALYCGLDKAAVGGRIPYKVIKSFILNLKNKENVTESCGLAVLESDNELVKIKKGGFVATESAFFAIIEESCSLEFKGFSVEALVNCGKALVSVTSEKDSVVLENVPVPFCVRSRQPDDYVETAAGGTKSVSDVLSDFCVKEKDSVPLVQELFSPEQKILAVIGSVSGYENWIVKN